MEIKINNAKVTSKYDGDGYMPDYEKAKTKYWFTKEHLIWFRKKYNVNPRIKDSTIIKNIIVEKVSPTTYPKFNNEKPFKVAGYNLVKPIIEKAEWDCCFGWTYRLKNLGHQFQAIKEDDISFV